ncbi:MAG: hypothetical protein O7B30_05455 [Thaumarchaeota archaeon]|nr:hypothetical protein [Nitrososphaerota archaeon]
MEFERVKGKAEKCKSCGKDEAKFLKDYLFLLPVAAPDTGKEIRFGGRGEFMHVKVKQCKRCNFLEMYQATLEEQNEYATGREITPTKFAAMPRH